MKKLFASLSLVAVFSVYVALRQMGGLPYISVAPADSASDSSSSAQGTASAIRQIPYRDGSYTGISADAFYGNIKVQVTVQGGSIADVRFLDYPKDRPNSVEVNTYAMPLLRSEAITAQSAPVDTVSGATFSSMAFNQSFASALAQATH
ncbi:MAG: FMN-binding protein [Candidatus Peribacteraceae bacterium]|nr:FMN-binding protein [Candidatus Peribacteraceae bacterium]MDD5742996.1 FMN-binding protein [Candidatus Peribacteraceae bacterium]